MKTIKDELTRILRKPQEDMAAHYRRISEMLDFVEDYMDFNIDDVAGRDIGTMTLDELREVLKPKIMHYSKYVATRQANVFREQDELEKWLIEGKRDEKEK